MASTLRSSASSGSSSRTSPNIASAALPLEEEIQDPLGLGADDAVEEQAASMRVHRVTDPGAGVPRVPQGKEQDVEIDKESVLKLIRERGDDEQTNQAENELPDRIDTERGAGLLRQFGVDAQDLTGGILGRGDDLPGI
jgi:hypothetical protein